MQTWHEDSLRALFGNVTEPREVLYPWHPWAGCIVHVHEMIEKASGNALLAGAGSALQRQTILS
jgi:hypothetical protein